MMHLFSLASQNLYLFLFGSYPTVIDSLDRPLCFFNLVLGTSYQNISLRKRRCEAFGATTTLQWWDFVVGDSEQLVSRFRVCTVADNASNHNYVQMFLNRSIERVWYKSARFLLSAIPICGVEKRGYQFTLNTVFVPIIRKMKLYVSSGSVGTKFFEFENIAKITR